VAGTAFGVKLISRVFMSKEKEMTQVPAPPYYLSSAASHLPD
jgi:hypothetical protein